MIGWCGNGGVGDGCLGGGGEYGRWCCEGGFGGALKLSGGVRGGVGRRPVFFEGIAMSCRFVYTLRRCQYLQGGCGGVGDDIYEQAMFLRNEMMRKALAANAAAVAGGSGCAYGFGFRGGVDG